MHRCLLILDGNGFAEKCEEEERNQLFLPKTDSNFL